MTITPNFQCPRFFSTEYIWWLSLKIYTDLPKQHFPGVSRGLQKWSEKWCDSKFRKILLERGSLSKKSLSNCFFGKILKRTTSRAFWSWEVANFFLTKPNFLPIINFFYQNHQKSTNVHCFFISIYKSLLLFPKYIGYKFYGCTTIFDKVMIFFLEKKLSTGNHL